MHYVQFSGKLPVKNAHQSSRHESETGMDPPVPIQTTVDYQWKWSNYAADIQKRSCSILEKNKWPRLTKGMRWSKKFMFFTQKFFYIHITV